MQPLPKKAEAEREDGRIHWPPLPGRQASPQWIGDSFVVEGQRLRVLSYECGASGWDESLAELIQLEIAPDKPIGQASRQHTLDELHRRITPEDQPTILEIGCGTGFLLEALKGTFPDACIVGADYMLSPLEDLADRLPGIPLVQFDVINSALPANCFDVIILLNVLEHIEDDEMAVTRLFEMLKPWGLLVIEVPAGPNLFDAFDRQVQHHRRYRMSGLTSLLISAGFSIENRSHLGFLVYPLFWLGKKKNRRLLAADDETQRRTTLSTMRRGSESQLLRWVFQLERRLRQFVYLPCGIRCLITCRKPQ